MTQEIAEKIRAFESGKITTYQMRLECKRNRVRRDAYEQHAGVALLASPRQSTITRSDVMNLAHL
jgi:hypothetical protein